MMIDTVYFVFYKEFLIGSSDNCFTLEMEVDNMINRQRLDVEDFRIMKISNLGEKLEELDYEYLKKDKVRNDD